jgi:hypothetical protein
MKPFRHLLWVSVIAGGVARADEAPRGLLSESIMIHVRESLPVYQTGTAPAAAANEPGDFSSLDDQLLLLPKRTVLEKSLPRTASYDLLTKTERRKQMSHLYLEDVAADGWLNEVLNSVTIPILSPTKAERGREIYLKREMERLSALLIP